ncbi:MAG TPA: ATP-binding protein [Kofleriaceae bacterium]|nr:ATP-binding protein [Kofleriaceae bacterium]
MSETELRARIDELEQTVRELRERHAVLTKLDAATQPLVDPRDIMQTTARILAEHLDVDRCAYANVENETVFDITGDWPRGVPSIVGRWDVALFGPACVSHMLENKPYVVDNVMTDPRISPELRASYRATTIEAVICVPLHKQGVFTAAMAVHQKVPRRWTPAEIELVTTVVGRCWEALERAAVTRTRVAAEAALADNRARLEYAVLLSGVGFWYCDLPFDELLWDDRVKAHFWLPPDARVTIDLFYDRIHPDDREATRAAIDTSIANNQRYDVIYRTVDPTTKRVKHVRAIGGAAYGPDGTPTRFDGVTLDVTALREQDQRKDEFLATLAHELRNPLAPIRTGLELLELAQDPADARRTVATMKRQLLHMVRMVDDLLDISRVTLGKVTLVSSRTDLRDIVDSALETTRGLIDAAGHTLEIELPQGPLPLDVDATRISQVVANLLSNAAKYTPRGGRIRIEASREDNGWLDVRVSDTGIGIAADALPAVFEMFTQLGQSIDRAQGGLGIGLTLARRLIEMHNGTITAASAGPNRGSTFTVRLPLALSNAAANDAAPPTTPRRTTPGGLRILVVDDNVDAAEMLAMLLDRDGNEIRVAHSGPDCLVLATELRPHVVLLDIGLPGLDGYEVARRLRADHSLAQPLIVAISGWGTVEDRKKAHEAGFDQHLVKPIDHAALAKLLATASTSA